MNIINNSNSNNVYELQFKINENLKILQRKNYLQNRNSSTSAKIKKHFKIMHHSGMQWNMFKKRSLQRQTSSKKLNNQKNFLKVVKPHEEHDDDLMEIINRIMILQRSVIGLSQNLSDHRRLQMCWIFFQCSLSIVFNAYNLVVFLLKIAYGTGNVPLSLAMLLLFYGYHIINPLMDTVLSILSYHLVYVSIRQTASIVDEINMYIFDVTLNNRLSQFSSYVYNNLQIFTLYGLYNLNGSLLTSILSGTTTYIIILIQYSDDGDICKNSTNTSMNNTKYKT